MILLVSLLQKTLRLLLLLVVLTVVGQIPFRGSNLENRYHDMVNSQHFQKTYWTLVRPVTWTSDKITKLFEKNRLYPLKSR